MKKLDDEEDIHIDNETMLDVLQLFGNDDLAFIVADEIEQLSKNITLSESFNRTIHFYFSPHSTIYYYLVRHP